MKPNPAAIATPTAQGPIALATLKAESTKNSSDAYAGFKTYTFLFRDKKIVDVRLLLPGDEMLQPR